MEERKTRTGHMVGRLADKEDRWDLVLGEGEGEGEDWDRNWDCCLMGDKVGMRKGRAHMLGHIGSYHRWDEGGSGGAPQTERAAEGRRGEGRALGRTGSRKGLLYKVCMKVLEAGRKMAMEGTRALVVERRECKESRRELGRLDNQRARGLRGEERCKGRPGWVRRPDMLGRDSGVVLPVEVGVEGVGEEWKDRGRDAEMEGSIN